MKGGSRAPAVGLLALASLASAQVGSVCPSTGVCYKLNIPQNTANTGSGDIFFQIQAPSSYEWVALGQGRGMANSNMFVVYTNSGGNNVTLSPRHTGSHAPPQHSNAAQVTLLEGSGVSNGVMTANVKCSNCNSWNGGTMDFTAGSGNWIYAYQPEGGPKNSDDTDAQINQHSGHGAFNWDFAQAKGGSSVNPLIATSTGTSGGSETGTTNGGTNNSGGANNSGSNTGFTAIAAASPVSNRREKLIAHGVLAALAFVIFFPMGGIAIRLVSMPGIVWLHGAFQIFGYLVYIAAAGLGIHLACGLNRLKHHHAIIGMILLAVMFFQPILGFMHHVMFKKVHARTIWSHAHLWVGRIFITLGIINGGLGMRLASLSNLSSTAGEIVYGIVAGLIWVAWVGAAIIGESRRKKAPVTETTKVADERANSDDQPMTGHYDPKRQ